MKRIEDMHAEQAYLKELRGGGDDDETDDEEEPTEEKKETPDKKLDDNDQTETPPDSPDVKKTKAERREEEDRKEFEDRVTSDPIDAARYYHRIASVTKQEFKTMQRQSIKAANMEATQDVLNSKLGDLE